MAVTYDAWLVLLSVVIAVLASYTALDLAARVIQPEGYSPVLWVAGGSLSMGIGIWAMHFVGMLAFHLPIPLAYDIPITIASAVPAIVASLIALLVIRAGREDPRTLALAATIMGLGIVAMHYSGMAALRMSPPIRYDPAIVALSVAIAIAASIFALRVGLRARAAATAAMTLRGRLASAALMGAAIAGMHYTGMAAAQFDPASVCLAAPQGVTPRGLAVVIGGGTLLLFGFTVATAALDSSLEIRANAIARAMTQELEAVIEGSPLAIYTRNLDGIITRWNAAAERMFGWPARDVVGRMLPTVPPGQEEFSAALRRRVLGGEHFVHADVRRLRRDGTPIDISTTLAPLRGPAGQVRGYVTIAADITERKRTEESLRLAARVFDSSNDGIVITLPDGTIVAVNEAFTRITGYTALEAVGSNPRLLQSGWQREEFYEAMRRSIEETGQWRGEIWDRRKGGELYAQWTSVSVVRDERGTVTHYVAVLSDVTARKAAEERLDHLATHDPLTDLPNRALFHESAREALARAERAGDLVAVLFLDLDNFKVINDTLGHYVGDRLLQETARRLLANLRSTDVVARQGGDEFTVLLEGLGGADEASAIARKLLDAVARPFHVEGHEVYATASLGVNLYPRDAQNVEDLLRNADVAMYHAKEQGRNGFQFYSARLNAGSRERLALETALRRAVERGELELHYQALVDLRNEHVTGAEALLRWHHPERGMITPGSFVPIAEASGLVVPIGEWVLHEACRRSKAWQEAGMGPLCVAVNVSARQFQDPRFPSTVRTALDRARLDPQFLELELTESLLMRNIEETARTLGHLRSLGVKLSIDDFGTGHSSLNYLKRFPVNKLKIDQSFVQGLHEDQEDAAIARAIISLGHGLDLRVTAEGVETPRQLARAKAEGCAEVQGFLIARPMRAADFDRFLAARR
jgi:diguanylate cyclase (GGDEF)-like protein/PAS domain S-box-containing protein